MKNNLFGSQGMLRPAVQETPMMVSLEALKSQVADARGSLVEPGVAKQVIAAESFGDDVRSRLDQSIENLSHMIKAIHAQAYGEKRTLSVAQESAAVAAGVLAANPRAALAAPLMNASRAQSAAAGNKFVTVVDGGSVIGLEARMVASGEGQFRPAVEAFDEKNNRDAVSYSIQYNMEAARQDAFGEMFFPTVTVTPDNVGFNVSVRLNYVQEEVRRSLSGGLSNFGYKNILEAVVDPTILRNDQTKLVPVVRSGGGANDSTAFFVAPTDVPAQSILVDGHSVVTAPLKAGAKLDLIAISQTDALIQAGVLDQTDAIDSSLRMGAIYVKLGAAGGDSVVKLTVKDLAGSDFNYSVQGNTRQLSLNATYDMLRFDAATTKVDGAVVAELAALGTDVARLNVTAFGNVLQHTGATTINFADVSVTSITNASGAELDLSTGAGATKAALFAGAKVIGYDLIGYRTNSNRRQRGQLIDTQFVNQLYTVPQLPPITALRPVGETEANDSALISSLIQTTRVRTSNAAVGALLEFRDTLKAIYSANDTNLHRPTVLGMGSWLVKPAYLEDTLDALDVDSLTTADRAEDLIALIVNRIRDMAYKLYTSSAYKAAADAYFDGAAGKPLLLIGTDPIIKRYMTLLGDTRTFGDHFDVRLEDTLDRRMTGKVIFSLGAASAENSGVPCPLHLGSMAWKPELTLSMPTWRNGATANELTVSPSFRHILNLPVMGVLDVQNISAVISKKVSINLHSV